MFTTNLKRKSSNSLVLALTPFEAWWPFPFLPGAMLLEYTHASCNIMNIHFKYNTKSLWWASRIVEKTICQNINAMRWPHFFGHPWKTPEIGPQALHHFPISQSKATLVAGIVLKLSSNIAYRRQQKRVSYLAIYLMAIRMENRNSKAKTTQKISSAMVL